MQKIDPKVFELIGRTGRDDEDLIWVFGVNVLMAW